MSKNEKPYPLTRPFLDTAVGDDGRLMLHVRQATNKGYAVCVSGGYSTPLIPHPSTGDQEPRMTATSLRPLWPTRAYACSLNMKRRYKVIGWSRSHDSLGQVTRYHLKDICNTITKCAGKGGLRDGRPLAVMLNTTPYLLIEYTEETT